MAGGIFYGCSAIQGLMGLNKLQFKLDNVNNFSVAGINVANATSRGDISVGNILNLTSAFAQKKLPVSFTLNVAVKNPNTGGNGKAATNLFLRKIAWNLLIDDRTTISGVTDQRLEIPGTGQTVTVPLQIGLDLYQFFGDKGFDDLLNLALALGGRSGSASRLKLTARVSAEIPGTTAVVEYPGDITIVDRAFSNP
jgi:hypothetical protein